MSSFEQNLGAFRNVPWGGSGGGADWVFLGENLAGSTYKLQIRMLKGDRTTVLVDLGTGIAGAQGLSWIWDAGYLDPVTGAVRGATIVTPLINQSTLEGLPWPANHDDPITFYYDFIVTPSGGLARVVTFGEFVLHPGVTVS